MALEGTFKDFHLADIVQLIGLQRKTGALSLEGEEDSLTLTFQDGAVVGAQSARQPWEQRVAKLLVARGLLTGAQLEQALGLQRENGQKLGPLLVEKGLLAKKDWEHLLAQEIAEALYRPFRWQTGRYRFVPQASVEPPEGRIGPLGAENLLMEGLRRADEWPLILERIPSPALIFQAASPVGKPNPKQFGVAELRLLALVDGKRTVQELVEASGVREFDAWQSLATLAGAGAIQSVEPLPATPVEAGVPGAPVTPPAARSPFALPAWISRLAWGLAVAWLVVSMSLFHIEPLALIPLAGPGLRALDEVRAARARAELLDLVRELERFTLSTGRAPASLAALGGNDGGLVKRLQDPWGHLYQIRPAGSGFSVLSAGPDGRFGTADDLTATDQ